MRLEGAPWRRSRSGGLIIGILWFSILTVIIALQDLSGSRTARPTRTWRFHGDGLLLLAFAIDIYRKEFMPERADT